MEPNLMKFRPLRARMRASFAAGQTEDARIRRGDRANRVLHDVQIALEGEAKGHGVWLDRAFCEAVAKAGNAMGEAGVKVRFGHPALCADALGTYLGRATNFAVATFRRAGTGEDVAGVVADVTLDEFADRTEWVLNMAESAPDTFGQSIVFTYGDFKVKDADGAEHSYRAECVDGVEDPDSKTGRKKVKTPDEWRAQSADGRVYAVLGRLHGTDFTTPRPRRTASSPTRPSRRRPNGCWTSTPRCWPPWRPTPRRSTSSAPASASSTGSSRGASRTSRRRRTARSPRSGRTWTPRARRSGN